MNMIAALMKRPTSAETLSISFFLGSVLFAVIKQRLHTIVAGVAFLMMMMGALPKQMPLAFLVGASVIVLLQTSRTEGFESGSDSTSTSTSTSGSDHEQKAENFGNKVMLPDNADRKEPLELGKPYKLPSENDDKGFHIDSGTTFLNAYKALKPEQISAMTKDTQDLMATQKNLMATLEALKPMLSDGQNMMNMFGSFFGSKA
jgi:hypothetical protein